MLISGTFLYFWQILTNSLLRLLRIFRSCVFTVVSKKKKNILSAQKVSWRDFQSPYNCTVLDICLKVDCLCQRALSLLLIQANCAGSRQKFCHIFAAEFPELHFASFYLSSADAIPIFWPGWKALCICRVKGLYFRLIKRTGQGDIPNS